MYSQRRFIISCHVIECCHCRCLEIPSRMLHNSRQRPSQKQGGSSSQAAHSPRRLPLLALHRWTRRRRRRTRFAPGTVSRWATSSAACRRLARRRQQKLRLKTRRRPLRRLPSTVWSTLCARSGAMPPCARGRTRRGGQPARRASEMVKCT